MHLVAILIWVALTTATDRSQVNSSSEEKEILRLEVAWVRALQTKDRKGLDVILGEEFTFIEPDGSVLNREAYLAERGGNPSENDSFENTDIKVSVFGTSAMASGLATVSERRLGKRYRFQLRWKELWLKGRNGWRVQSGQATPVNPQWDEPFGIPEK